MNPTPVGRSGQQPGAFGLTGSAGLQLKPKTGLAGKKYGLQKPAKKPNVFGAAAEQEETVNEELGRMHAKARAAAAAADAAAEEEAGVYDYDGVYDEMQEERALQRQARLRGAQGASAGAGAGAAADAPKERQKARYIGAIMEAHKEREIENDKLFERKMQKEAEAEAHLYGDKERFMTSAYKKKLAAREEYEAAQKAKEAADAANDVTKRADLSGFYSNLLHGTLAGDAKQGGSAALDAAYSLTSGAR